MLKANSLWNLFRCSSIVGDLTDFQALNIRRRLYFKELASEMVSEVFRYLSKSKEGKPNNEANQQRLTCIANGLAVIAQSVLVCPNT